VYNQVAELISKLNFAEPDKLAATIVAALLFLIWTIFFIVRIWHRPARTHGSRYPLFGTIKFGAFASVMCLMVLLAWAWPFLSSGSVAVKRGGVEVVFVIDVSSSMLLKGMGLARVDVATREIDNLVSSQILKAGDRASLIVFARHAYTRIPLTSDIEGGFAGEVSKIGRIKTLLSNDLIWETYPVTVFERIYKSLDRQDQFAEFGMKKVENWQPRRKSNRLVVVFSDGDFFNFKEGIGEDAKQREKDELNKAFGELRKRGLRVYLVGIGKRNGENLVDILDDYKEGEYDPALRNGLKDIVSRLDVASLEYIARANNGEVFLIENIGNSAGGFLQRVMDSHRSTTVESVPQNSKQDIWQYFLFAALFIFAVAVLFY